MSEVLQRTAFSTSRLLEFFTEKELNMQIGYGRQSWGIALLKELIDNALDACESAGIAPEIRVTVEQDSVTVEDNGPGLPYPTLAQSLDYAVRVSDKSHYISPTRGQLGNALKCVWAAPFVVDGEYGCVEVATPNYAYQVEIRLDRLAQRPQLDLVETGRIVKKGTFIKMYWRGLASILAASGVRYFYISYVAFNPHATFYYSDPDSEWQCHRRGDDWAKWTASTPTSPHWYNLERLKGLIAAYIAAEQDGGMVKTVREFIAEFRGLSSTAKQQRVAANAGMTGLQLHDLVTNGDVRSADTALLLDAMQEESRAVPADMLGVIGESVFKVWFGSSCAPESFQYARSVSKKDAALPYVIEVTSGILNPIEGYEVTRTIHVGLNWTPALQMPLTSLYPLLAEQMVDEYDPVMLVIHIACPRLDFTDRGKSRLALDPEMQEALTAMIKRVTKAWQAQKKQLRRDQKMRENQLDELRKQKRRQTYTIKDAAQLVMADAYLKASDNGRLPANARQIMYAARPLIQQYTSKPLDDQYFTQTLLPRYIDDNPQTTAAWDVVYDARGRIIEPHTAHEVGLGTLLVRRYIQSWETTIDPVLPRFDARIDTHGPANRYAYALFIEKEGFSELLTAANFARLYDLAIMSTKGMSVTASRSLVEELSAAHVTVLVLHDFDKAGFSIVHTISHDTPRYHFKVKPQVIDLGLRLLNVQAMGLQSESVSYPSAKDPRHNLLASGATVEEAQFLVRRHPQPKLWTGERVELNAMTSPQFVEWLDQSLRAIGVQKVVPDDGVLLAAYRRAVQMRVMQQAVDQALKGFDPATISLPANFAARIRQQIEGTGAAWDDVLTQLPDYADPRVAGRS